MENKTIEEINAEYKDQGFVILQGTDRLHIFKTTDGKQVKSTEILYSDDYEGAKTAAVEYILNDIG